MINNNKQIRYITKNENIFKRIHKKEVGIKMHPNPKTETKIKRNQHTQNKKTQSKKNPQKPKLNLSQMKTQHSKIQSPKKTLT